MDDIEEHARAAGARLAIFLLYLGSEEQEEEMKSNVAPPFPINHRAMLVRLSTETADALDDFRLAQQRKHRRRVTKRDLVEHAVRLLIGLASNE